MTMCRIYPTMRSKHIRSLEAQAKVSLLEAGEHGEQLGRSHELGRMSSKVLMEPSTPQLKAFEMQIKERGEGSTEEPWYGDLHTP